MKSTVRNNQPSAIKCFGLTALACIGTTVVATPLLGHLDLANIVMLFLLTVLVIAVKLGRRAAVLASILNVLLFDVFFVAPRFSLAVSNIQYLVTFAVMLVTGLTTAHFTSALRQKAKEAEQREQRTEGLYQLARQLAGTLTKEQVVEITEAFIGELLDAQSCILVPDETRQVLLSASASNSLPIESHLAKVALESGKRVRSDEVGSMGYAPLYLPLGASMRVRGVLAVRFADKLDEPSPETTALLEAVASLAGVALERLHYVEVAQATEVKMLTERLRSSILSALSHDLRTPLTAMVGLADSLFLINMARLNAGEVTLRREWQPLEEVIGAGIKLLGNALAEHPVKVELPADLPLLEFDAVLVERVLCNLLENAAKYAPAHTPIELTARRAGNIVEVMVKDRGPGFPENSSTCSSVARPNRANPEPGWAWPSARPSWKPMAAAFVPRTGPKAVPASLSRFPSAIRQSSRRNRHDYARQSSGHRG